MHCGIPASHVDRVLPTRLRMASDADLNGYVTLGPDVIEWVACFIEKHRGQGPFDLSPTVIKTIIIAMLGIGYYAFTGEWFGIGMAIGSVLVGHDPTIHWVREKLGH